MKTTAGACAPTGHTARLDIVDQASTTAPHQFSPRELDIACGTKVTVSNGSAVAHTWTGSGWDSGNLDPAASYSYTFRYAGAFSFLCSYHTYMTGKVVVS